MSSKRSTAAAASSRSAAAEYVLFLGRPGVTKRGNPNLDTIARDVARAILEKGGGKFLEVRGVEGCVTPYMQIRSHNGVLDPGCVTMNALLEIAAQMSVGPESINQAFLATYAEHPFAQIPPSLRILPQSSSSSSRARRVQRSRRDAIPGEDRTLRPAPAPAPAPRRRRPQASRRASTGEDEDEDEEEDEDEDEDENEGAVGRRGGGRRKREDDDIDTDAEQEDIMRRARRLYEKDMGRHQPREREREDRRRRDEEEEDEDGYMSEGDRVVPGIGRVSARVVGKKRKGSKYFQDPGLASIYGNVNANLLGEPSDAEDGPRQRAGLEVEEETEDEEERRGSRLREVTISRAFDPDFDLGVSKFVRNPRKVVLHSVSESKFVTRDSKKMQRKIEEEVKSRSEQTRRLKEQMMRDKELHGDDMERPIDERKLIKRSADPMDLQKQIEHQRRVWEQNQTRRIPGRFRDGTGKAFQEHARKRQYNESDRVRKIDGSSLLHMQKSVGRERSRLNTRMWAPDSDDSDGEPGGMRGGGEDGDSYYEDGGDGGGDDDDDYTHEHGFSLTDDEGDEEEERRPARKRAARSSSSKMRRSDRKVQISNALYSSSSSRGAAYDDDGTSGEDEDYGDEDDSGYEDD